MRYQIKQQPKTNEKYISTSLTGDLLLDTAQLNKGTAFTEEERDKFLLRGKLPLRIESLEEQVARVLQQYQSMQTTQQKSIFLHELFRINQTLFFKLVSDNIAEMLPIIYTPEVANTVQNYSAEFRKPTGMYISYPDKAYISQILDNRPIDKVDLIVATDGERILGIGDQGVGGIGISQGKLMLYSVLGGINPLTTLPIVLDVGTNNSALLSDPKYLGWRHQRITNSQYDDFIYEFITAIKLKMPQVFLQWEDFGRNNAAKILETYRKLICSFNDDIQGTAVVTFGAISAALKITNQKLIDQKIVFFGAGSAAIGIAELITSAMVKRGMTEKDARKCFWFVDENGLLNEKSPHIFSTQKPFVRENADFANWSLENSNSISLFDVVKNLHPTILIGVSTVAKAFSEKIVKEMLAHTPRPIILPLSNPTEKCEAIPADLIKWTDARALIATGSPFPPVSYNGQKIVIAQCNNALVFPGIGLGAIAVKARQVSDEMLWAASQTLLNSAPCLKDQTQPILPEIKDAPMICRKIGYAVAAEAMQSGIATLSPESDLNAFIDNYYWSPEYLDYQLEKF